MHRYDAAEHLRTNMRRLGIPVECVTGNANQLYTKVIEEKDYHIYTGGQFTWRFPIAFSLLGFRVMLEFLAPKIMETTPLTGWREWITGLQEKKIKQYLEEGRVSWTSPTFTESLAHSRQAQGRIRRRARNRQPRSPVNSIRLRVHQPLHLRSRRPALPAHPAPRSI